jgi:N-acetylated-alpha-linked acidic dipeptidase
MNFPSRVSLVFALAWVLLFVHVADPQTTPSGPAGTGGDSAVADRKTEETFRGIPKPENLREYMQAISGEPHHAGGPGSRKVAEYILSKFKSWGLDARIEEFEALMPYPTVRALDMVEPERYEARLREPVVPDDPDSGDPGQLPTFNAYSADGDVTADLVYVNYGIPEDYEQLARLGVDVKGKIVIARYGRSWRGIKPKVAWEHGAVGCLIYSDPRDDGYFEGDVYPRGAYRPDQGVQRGSVMDMPIHPGDPLTPGTAAEPGVKRMERSQSDVILKIPVLPISYGDALPLLKQLKGPVAPENWRGALPITYHVGPGPAKVHLKVAFDWQTRPLYDVIARIEGNEWPDQWIIHGNHHDAWVNGASDPTSGQVALMEEARAFGELLKTGWRPKRTIVLAAWDGEEWGLLGSTEWAEKHAADLSKSAAVYINSDSSGKGWIGMSGSHSLEKFMNGVARDVKDPSADKSLLDTKRAHDLDQAKTDEERKKIESRTDAPLGALGSGSDYTAFLDYLAIASLNLGFGGDDGGGVYHSIYDSFYWYTHFSDTDFVYGATLARTIGTAILRLADADLLPFEFTATARTLSEYVDDIEKVRSQITGAEPVDLARLREAISGLQKAADAYSQAATTLRATDAPHVDRARLAHINRLLYTTERAFRYDKGLPRREWFKHLAYAPGFYTGYGVKTLPGIREAIEQKNWDEARQYVPIVASAIDALAQQIQQATTAVAEMNSSHP